MDHVFAKDSVGDLILIELRSLQIESGSGIHLLEDPTVRLPYLTACWITSMRDFMARHSITMEVTQAKIVPLSREGDCHLMDRFRELGCFDDDELHQKVFVGRRVAGPSRYDTLKDVDWNQVCPAKIQSESDGAIRAIYEQRHQAEAVDSCSSKILCRVH
jgi:hypothetical protein